MSGVGFQSCAFDRALKTHDRLIAQLKQRFQNPTPLNLGQNRRNPQHPVKRTQSDWDGAWAKLSARTWRRLGLHLPKTRIGVPGFRVKGLVASVRST